MARALMHWRHISVAWNYEVYRTIFADIEWSDSDWAMRWSYGRWGRLPMAWWNLGASKDDLRRNVKIFHFSGSHLQPWWYLYLLSTDSWSITKAENAIDAEFFGSDSRGLTGLAVSEWLQAVVDAQAEFSASPHNEHISDSISSLANISLNYRDTCPRCGRNIWTLNQQPLYELCGNKRRFKANPRATMCCEECVIQSTHTWYLKRKTTTLCYEEWVRVKRSRAA